MPVLKQTRLARGVLALAFGLFEGFHSMPGIEQLPPIEQFFDRENLETRIPLGKVSRFIKACRGGLGEHGLRRFAQRDKSADHSFLAFENALQVAHVVHAHVAAFHLRLTDVGDPCI